MRKISFIMAALALVLGVTQCKKEDKPVASGETQRIVLTASNGNNGSKVVVNETPKMLNLTWQDTDKIAASGAVEGTLAYKSDVEPGTATFEGSVTRKEGETVTFSIGSTPESFEDQTGDVTWIQNHLYLVGTADYNEKGVYGQDEKVEMQLQYAVLKLDLSALGTVEGTTVTISNASGTVATVTNVTKANKVYYVAMPAAASTTYTFSGNGKSVEKTWPLAANIFYTKNEDGDAILVGPAPAISGDFYYLVDENSGHSECNIAFFIENIDWGAAESGNVFVRIDNDKIIELKKDCSENTLNVCYSFDDVDSDNYKMIKEGETAQLWLETIYGSTMLREITIVHV